MESAVWKGLWRLTLIQSSGRVFTAACALMGTAAAITTLEVDGKDFVNSKTKERFQIIGVEYVHSPI